MLTPIDIARRELMEGVREATGKNDGIPATRYNDGECKPWCAAFVRFCFEQCGITLPGKRWMQPSVAYLEGMLEAHAATIDTPEPGAIVTFKWRIGSDAGAGRHVELVEEVSETEIVTIGGNVGEPIADRVLRRVHKRSAPSINKYFRWPRRGIA